MEITKTKPEKFIATLPDELRSDIEKLHKAISKALPKVEAVMWEGKFWGGSDQNIIGYGKYSYTGSNKKTGEWFLTGLAQQKNYITVFINAVESREYLAEKYKDKLGKVKAGKSTVSFKKLSDVNLDNLIDLIKKGYKLMTKK